MRHLCRACTALLVGVAAAACGAGDPPGGDGPLTLDLLVRRADAVFEELGALVPAEGEEWGAHGGPGWTKEVSTTADGTPYLDTNQPRASLRLPASRSVAREVELTVWCASPVPGSPGTAQLILNGLSVGEVPLAPEPTVALVPIPAELWRLGDNRLELVVPLLEDSGPPRWDTVSVARVAYGAERRVVQDPHARRATLPDATGLRYLVETGASARLRLAGRASAPGTLTLRHGAMAPRTGAIDRAGFADLTLPFSGERDHEAPLPVRAGAVLALDLSWSSPDGGTLELARLEVYEPAGAVRPPIVFVSIDTLAARHTSIHGYERSTTPNLERLAEDAVVFERCVANAPWTMPSYLSVMTGLYPGAHVSELMHSPGLELQNWDYWQVAESRWTLAEALRSRGYQTAASVDTLWLSPRFRVHQGFDLYDLEAAHYPFDQPYYGIAFILDRLGPWLDQGRRPDAPFFAFIHALDAHGPYWPEEPFLDAFADGLPEDRRPTQAGGAYQTYGAIPTWMARTLVPNAEEPVPPELPLEEIVARYDETILKTDAYLGRLCDMLRERGLYDDCVLVVTADHGESFAHGSYSHGNLWEDVVHVPLLVKLPESERGGTRVQASVQLVDVYPTLLELAGADGTRTWLHGRSLLPLMRGEADPPRPTFSQGGHVEQAMVEHEGWKLVQLRPGVRAGEKQLLTHPRVPRAWLEEHYPELVDGVLTEELWLELRQQPGFGERFRELRELLTGPYYELYDLTADPDETRDLAAERPEIVARLRPLLETELQRALRARADATADAATEAFSEEELRRLAELGYTGD